MYDDHEREILLPPRIHDNDNVEKIRRDNIVLFNSKDRNYLYDSNFNFSITFSPSSEQTNITTTYINTNFKNILEVKFVKLILPNIYTNQLFVNAMFQEQILNSGNIISTFSPFITQRANFNSTYKDSAARTAATNSIRPIKYERISDLPYLLLNISEIQNTNYGTNKEINKSSFVLILDDSHDLTVNSGSLSLNASNVLVPLNNYSQSTCIGIDKKMLHYKALGDVPISYNSSPLQYIKNLNINISTPEGKILSNLNDYLVLRDARASNSVRNYGRLNINSPDINRLKTMVLNEFKASDSEGIILEIGEAVPHDTNEGEFTTSGLTGIFFINIDKSSYGISANVISEYISFYSLSESTTPTAASINKNTEVDSEFREHIVNLGINEMVDFSIEALKYNNFIILRTKKWFSSDEYSIGTKIIFKDINFDSSQNDDTYGNTLNIYIVNSELCTTIGTNNMSNSAISLGGIEWYQNNTPPIKNPGIGGNEPWVWHFFSPDTDTWFYSYTNRSYEKEKYLQYGSEYLLAGANNTEYSSGMYISPPGSEIPSQGLTYQTNYTTSGFNGNIELFNTNWQYEIPNNPNAIWSDDRVQEADTSTNTNENIGGERKFEKQLFKKFLERSEGHTIIGLEHSENLPDEEHLNEYGEIISGGTYQSDDVDDAINPTTTRLFDVFFIPFDYKLNSDVESNREAKIEIDNNFALPQDEPPEFGNGICVNSSMQNILALNVITETIDFTKLYSNV
jgi:hypothetical protein